MCTIGAKWLSQNANVLLVALAVSKQIVFTWLSFSSKCDGTNDVFVFNFVSNSFKVDPHE